MERYFYQATHFPGPLVLNQTFCLLIFRRFLLDLTSQKFFQIFTLTEVVTRNGREWQDSVNERVCSRVRASACVRENVCVCVKEREREREHSHYLSMPWDHSFDLDQITETFDFLRFLSPKIIVRINIVADKRGFLLKRLKNVKMQFLDFIASPKSRE